MDLTVVYLPKRLVNASSVSPFVFTATLAGFTEPLTKNTLIDCLTEILHTDIQVILVVAQAVPQKK